MAGEWKALPLSAVCEQIVDCPHSTPTWTSHGVIVLRNQNIRNGRLDLSSPSYTDEMHYEDRSRRARLRAGDIVITREAPMGEVCMVPTGLKCCLGQRMVMLRPDSRLCDPHYLLYSLQSPAVQHEILVNEGTGSTVSNLRIPLLKALRVQVPKLAEQRAIAHILGTLDDKIELNRRMNETLEGMARAIFKSWFVDFDPVRAKADGRQPAGMDPAIAALFPDSFEDSPLGKIPKGWKVETLAGVADLNGLTLSKSDKLDRIDYVEISEVMRGDISSIATYVRGQEPSRARRRLRHGDTALSTVRPDRGAYFLCLDPSSSLIASTGFAVLTPRQAPWSFVYLTASRQEMLDELGRLADGGAYPAVRPEIVGALDVIRPRGVRILHSFHRICAPLLLRVNANRREQRSLAALRDALLPKLLSGEIRVPEAEELVDVGLDGQAAPASDCSIARERPTPRKATQSPANGFSRTSMPITEPVSQRPVSANGQATPSTAPRLTMDDFDLEEIMAAFRQAARGRGLMERKELLKEVSARLGFVRLGPAMRETLKGHLRAAIRRGIIYREGQLVGANTQSMESYTRDELVQAIVSVTRKGASYDRSELVQAVARRLGFQRVTAKVREPIKSAINGAIRRGILAREGATVNRIE